MAGHAPYRLLLQEKFGGDVFPIIVSFLTLPRSVVHEMLLRNKNEENAPQRIEIVPRTPVYRGSVRVYIGRYLFHYPLSDLSMFIGTDGIYDGPVRVDRIQGRLRQIVYSGGSTSVIIVLDQYLSLTAKTPEETPRTILSIYSLLKGAMTEGIMDRFTITASMRNSGRMIRVPPCRVLRIQSIMDPGSGICSEGKIEKIIIEQPPPFPFPAACEGNTSTIEGRGTFIMDGDRFVVCPE